MDPYLEECPASPLFADVNMGSGDLYLDDSLSGLEDKLSTSMEKQLEHILNRPSTSTCFNEDAFKVVWCYYCGRSCDTLGKLRSHIAFQHTESSDFAEIQEESQLSAELLIAASESELRDCLSNLQNSEKDNNKRPYSCPHCEYRAAKSGNLKTHIQSMHTGEKPYSCGFCDYTCVQSSQMNNHIKAKHMEERLLECTHCTYKCAQSGHLKRHIQAKHTGEKPFNCNFCKYQCVQLIHLQRHIRAKHTGEKPFECQFCDFKCVQSGVLKRHISSKHNGEKGFACSFCDYKCLKSNLLTRHMDSKHMELDYEIDELF